MFCDATTDTDVTVRYGTQIWNTVAGCTDAIQPVDAGLGRLVKRLYRDLVDEWLDDDDNLDAWEGHMPASDRRMYIT